jgi:1-deoxy-D-xylulose-5-phosphate synthase
VKRLGLPDRFIEHGSQAELRASLSLDAGGIREAIQSLAQA